MLLDNSFSSLNLGWPFLRHQTSLGTRGHFSLRPEESFDRRPRGIQVSECKFRGSLRLHVELAKGAQRSAGASVEQNSTVGLHRLPCGVALQARVSQGISYLATISRLSGQHAIRVFPSDVLSHSQVGVLSVEQKNAFYPITFEAVDSRESVTTGRVQQRESGE